MAKVVNKHTAPLGLPGPAMGLGGVELQPGENDVPDALWAVASENPTVKHWLAIDLVVDMKPAPAARKA